MDYKLIWEDEAIEELGLLVAFIARDNPAAAQKLGEKILAQASGLGPFPRLGKVFKQLAREDVREISVPPYRLVYHVVDSTRCVRIVKIWHGAREEPDL